MAGKRILLTLNSEIHKEVEKLAEDNLMSVQEYIADTLRKNVLSNKNKSK